MNPNLVNAAASGGVPVLVFALSLALTVLGAIFAHFLIMRRFNVKRRAELEDQQESRISKLEVRVEQLSMHAEEAEKTMSRYCEEHGEVHSDINHTLEKMRDQHHDLKDTIAAAVSDLRVLIEQRFAGLVELLHSRNKEA